MKKVVIVSGGANGLGLELVEILHKNGYFVCNIDKDEKALNSMKNKFSANYKSFCGNVADEKFVISSIEVISEIGDIFALFNCAGSPVFKFPAEYTLQDVDLCFEGLKGMILLSANTLKVMEKIGGKIINIMSSAALRGNKQESVYCATK